MSKKMNGRERFLETARFGHPDRCFLWPEGVGAHGRWNLEGMPHFESGVQAAEYFGWDYLGGGMPKQFGINIMALPGFEKKVVHEDDQYLIYWEDGKKYQQSKDSDCTTVLEHPVKTIEDFPDMKKRFHPDPSQRYPADWDDRVRQWRNRDYPIMLKLQGLFGRASSWLGYPELCQAFYDQPDLVHQMMDFWTDFYIALFHRLMEAKVVDLVMVGELGLAHVAGPSISPRTIREFIAPCYVRLIDFFKSHGVGIFFLREKGNLEQILPVFLETGINATSNINQKSNNDVFVLREKYPRLIMMGGLSSRVLREDEKTIENEIMSKVPALLEKGGYFPCLDGGILQDVPYANFLYYIDLLHRVVGVTGDLPPALLASR